MKERKRKDKVMRITAHGTDLQSTNMKVKYKPTAKWVLKSNWIEIDKMDAGNTG